MERETHEQGELLADISNVAEGAGPLFERDYWAVIRRSALSPSQVMALVARRFAQLAPEELVTFRPSEGEERPLELGDQLDIHIAGAGRCRVRVTHQDLQSFTLATLTGHPEAGRITFGAYRNQRGDVLFHIRSRARARSSLVYFGYRVLGDAMQHNTWSEFVNRVAATVGKGVIGQVHTRTKKLAREDEEPPEASSTPTFLAQGG